MVDVRQLLDACLRNESQAWPTFWGLLVEATSSLVAALLWQHHFDPGRADVVLQEFYLHLAAEDCARLAAFHGQTLAELNRFLSVAVHRFTVKLLRQWRTDARREARARRDAPAARRDGPTAEQVAAARRELEAFMTDKGRAKLRRLDAETALDAEDSESGRPAGPSLPERTRRRRQRELYLKYGELVG